MVAKFRVIKNAGWIGSAPLVSPSGWPDWANFRLMGWLFTSGSFFNYRSSPTFWAALFPRYKWCIFFDKKWIWLHFGTFFHKLIWSPWPPATYLPTYLPTYLCTVWTYPFCSGLYIMPVLRHDVENQLSGFQNAESYRQRRLHLNLFWQPPRKGKMLSAGFRWQPSCVRLGQGNYVVMPTYFENLGLSIVHRYVVGILCILVYVWFDQTGL
jgi:hypothetical protein